MQQSSERPTVFIVDDDAGMRKSLAALLEDVMNLSVEVFATPDECLADGVSLASGCLLLDARLPGMNGLALHRELVRRGVALPTLLITGNANQELIDAAREQGILEVFEKPYQPEELMQAIRRAIDG